MKPIAVFIGRFQPFHYGHQAIIEHIVKLGYRPHILVGVAKSKTDRSPISFKETSLNLLCKTYGGKYYLPRPLYDCNDNLSWVKQIDNTLNMYEKGSTFYLVVHNKPSEAGKYGLQEGQFISDFILANSTKITDSINLSSMETPSINATDIRNSMTELLKLAPKSSLQTLLEAL